MVFLIAPENTSPSTASRGVLLLAGLTIAIHFAVNLLTPYGIHRDEFLYLAMGRHLHLWRMEFPPGIAVLSKFSHTLLGDSILAIRFLPAVAAGFLVFLSGKIARHLGGSHTAQIVAAIAVLTCPLFLRAGNLFQPVVFDQLVWTVALYSLVRLAETEQPKWLIWFGTAAGLGLLLKFSAIFFGAAALLAMIVTPQRRWFTTRWAWIAVVIALALGSPSVVGQIRLGYPVLTQMRDLQHNQLDYVTPWSFIGGQFLFGPGFLLAIAGLVALIFKPLRRFAVVGWTCIFAFLILLVLHGKAYYVGPIYPALFGAGAVAIDHVSLRVVRIGLRWVMVSLLLAYGLLIFPVGVPILRPAQMANYLVSTGLTAALRNNQGQLERLPQDYADMLGWPEQVDAVARVYRSLSPEDRARAVIIADNYGEAGAIDYYGPRLGIPNAVSATGTYWFFGPGDKPGDVTITIGVPGETLKEFFNEQTLATRVVSPWSVMEERDVPIFIARHPKKTLQEVWPSLAGRN